ncbi:effector-associated domain 2-containing protein [Streptomyces sp. UG1]|uniref:VMAP-C domain-containing protein n=1 Tax=Streptomyces sp. UG1 TaxID=3417652 RepID=UPI003CF1799D
MTRSQGAQGAWGPPKVLLDALDAVPCFEESALLHECARQVSRMLGCAVTLPESSRRRVSLMFLLREVMPYPDGLQVLGGVVSMLEGETRHMARVRTAIALVEAPLFAAHSWERLMALLGGLEVLDVAGVFHEALGDRPDPLPAHCAEPWSAVLHAANLNARPGEPPPCVLLVEYLARYAKGQQQQELLDWVAEHRVRPETYTGAPPADGTAFAALPVAAGAERAPLAIRSSQSVCASVTPAPPVPLPQAEQRPHDPATGPVWAPTACLLIRLRPLPDPDHEGERLLSYWWRIGDPDPYPRRGGDVRVDVADLPEHVKALVQEAETGWAYFWKEDLTLEFLLPRDLLDLPIEQWAKEGFHGAEGTLGEDHPVVLRSLERMERTDTHGRWAKRWDALVTDSGGPVHWFPDDGGRGRLLADPQPVMVVLSDPPGSRPAGTSVDELAESLRAGVPIVVWDRRGGVDPAFRNELRELTSRKGILRLPDAVRSLRIEAGGEDPAGGGSSTLGRHAALLWDDPYRLPGGRGDAAD